MYDANKNLIMTPDNPEFFSGSREEILKRIHAYIGSLGQKYGHAEEKMFEEWEMLKYERPVVDVVEWLNSDEYFGHVGKKAFDVIKEDFYTIMTKEPRPLQVLLKGGIGWGKTFLAALIMARLIYEISCLRSPQAYFGLSPESKIVMMNLSISKGHARRVLYQLLMNMIDGSPYFREYFPRRMSNNALLDWEQKRIAFIPGTSSDLSPIGENLFGGVIDEANFFPIVKGSRRSSPDELEYEAVKYLHTSIWRRMKSRYQAYGRVPGMLVLSSSAKYPDDYLEKLERQADPNEIMVIRHAEWETKPKNRYCGRTFKFFVGSMHLMPQFVSSPIEEEELKKQGEIIEVPIEYKSDFEKDPLGALRDIAGRNVRIVNRFITDDDRIDFIFKAGATLPKPHGNKYDTGIVCTELNEAVNPIDLLRKEVRLKMHENDYEPVLAWHPEAGRFCHIDLSSTGDCTGLAIVHVGEVKEIERRIERDESVVEIVREMVPIIYVDCVLRIIPPPKGEIEFEEIRNLIHRFVEEAGMRFIKITFDQYQSRHSQQLLKKRFGEDVVQPLSVDRTNDAYIVLKEAIYERRLKSYFYPPLIQELKMLIRNPKTGKVDHPPKGSKDVADALAGAVFSATKDFDKSFIDTPQLGEIESEKDLLEQDPQLQMVKWLLGEEVKKPKPPKPEVKEYEVKIQRWK